MGSFCITSYRRNLERSSFPLIKIQLEIDNLLYFTSESLYLRLHHIGLVKNIKKLSLQYE